MASPLLTKPSRPKPPPPDTVHATAVAIGERGVLLLGGSGMGKSDLALRLIDRGARLVADDRCVVAVRHGALVASPAESLAGKIEVRGLGIMTLPHRADVPLWLAVRLVERYERLPDGGPVEPLNGHVLPALWLSAFESSAPIKIEMAVRQIDRRPPLRRWGDATA